MHGTTSCAETADFLACAIYSRVNEARNDYLHGNKVSDVQLVIMPSQRFLPDYAPALYRMALAALLDLRFKEIEPDHSNIEAYLDWEGRKFAYEKYQSDMELALGTFNQTVQQQHERLTGRA